MHKVDIREFLSKYKNEHIYYLPNPGNGGDALIAFATYYLFKEQGIRYSIVNKETDLTGKTVFYGGGGNLVKEYFSASDFISANLSKFKELVVLPHTINGHHELIAGFDKNVTLLCREHLSYKYVQSAAPMCTCYLVEDLAFSLPIEELRKNKLKRNIIPIFLKKYVFRMFRYQGQVFYPILNILLGERLKVFRIDAEKTAISRPKDNLDLSLLILYDPSMHDEKLVTQNAIDILSVLNKYKVVYTNRLHICIGAALLGKKVEFYANSYYKNEGIYQTSLKDKFPNVNWCGDRSI